MSEDESAEEDADWFERAIADAGPADEADDTESEALSAAERGEPDEPAAGSGESDWPAAGEPAAESGESDWPAADEPAAESGESDWPAAGETAAESEPPGDSIDTEPWSTELGASDDEAPFEEDFASAFQGGAEGFEDESFESDIPRLDIGIDGLDDMIQGGVPERSLITAIGAAGTGKTTIGLQFLNHGLQHDQPGVFITLEQTRESILDTANELGWDFEAAEAAGDLAVVDLDPVEMANSLDNIRAELPDLVADFGAARLVLDSVSLLEMMYDDQAKRRTEVYDFTRSLKEAGVTTFLTSEAADSTPYSSRFGIIEYLTDAVLILRYVRAESREARLAIEIMKIRNANHSRETKPYAITDDGITVYQQANIF